jgi:hypothetical protein
VWKLPKDKPFHSLRIFQLTYPESKSFTKKILKTKLVLSTSFSTRTPACYQDD